MCLVSRRLRHFPFSTRLGTDPKAEQADLIRKNEEKFRQIFPELDRFHEPRFKGGIIVARGATDIDDPKSQLHERVEEPVFCDDGYFSLSTSKFTCAPRNTLVLERILGHNLGWSQV